MEHFAASDRVQLAYRIDDFTDPWRPCETVLLLHAAQGCGARFYAWVPHLARDFRVVRLDLRGHGESEIPSSPSRLTTERLVLDVVELIDKLGCRAVHLVGSSAGAMIAMMTAVAHPDRVSSLAAYAATAGMRDASFDFEKWAQAIKQKGVRRFLHDSIWHRFNVQKTDPRLIAWWLDLAEISNKDPDYAASFVALMRSLDLKDEIARIGCPTLCVVPRDDPEHALSEYEVLRDRIPGVRFITIPEHHHNITDAIPDRCATIMREFLTSLPARS